MVDREVVEAGRPAQSGSRTSNIEMEAPDHPCTGPRPSRDSPTTAADGAAAAAEAEDRMELKYGAEHVIRKVNKRGLFVPVSICMALVIFTMKSSTYYSEQDGPELFYTPMQTTSEDSTTDRITGGLINALIIIAVVVVMTFGLILLYKYKCYKIIGGWLILNSVVLLSFFSMIYVSQLMEMNGWCASSPTVFIGLFNFAVMGIICVHWKGPFIMQQGYLITVSALMALTFIKLLPDWTPWALLGLISIWDLIAVLCSKGPLNMLVKMSQERNEPIFPALIYSSGILLPYTIAMSMVGEGETEKMEEEGEGVEGGEREGATTSASRRVTPQEEEEGDKGVKLGLGDFIFYSVLVGMASKSEDWNTVVACYVAILVGLCATLLLLAVFKKALPALPISIFAGLIFYFCTAFLITPFTTQLVTHQLTY